MVCLQPTDKLLCSVTRFCTYLENLYIARRELGSYYCRDWKMFSPYYLSFISLWAPKHDDKAVANSAVVLNQQVTYATWMRRSTSACAPGLHLTRILASSTLFWVSIYFISKEMIIWLVPTASTEALTSSPSRLSLLLPILRPFRSSALEWPKIVRWNDCEIRNEDVPHILSFLRPLHNYIHPALSGVVQDLHASYSCMQDETAFTVRKKYAKLI